MIPVGRDLHRPECVLATASGDLYCSDARGGVTRITPAGRQVLHTGATADLPGGLLPNGIALERDGSFLLAHLGAEGGVFRLDRTGQLAPHLREVDGAALPSTNFVTRDRAGRLWATISTTVEPRHLDYRADAHTGSVILADERGARVVADGLGYTNECLPTPDGAWLYVNETFARRLSRFPIVGNALGRKEVVAEFGPGEFPDGLGLDVEGGVWVVCVVANRVLRVDPGGGISTVLDAGVAAHVAAVEEAYIAGAMGSEHVADDGGSPLGQCSSIAFGGPDRRTAYLGSLHNPHLTRVDAPAVGVEPPHWRY